MKIKGRLIIDFLEAFKAIDTDKGYNIYLKIPNEMLHVWNITGWKSCKIIFFLIKDHYHFSLMPIYLFQNNILLFVIFFICFTVYVVCACVRLYVHVWFCVFTSLLPLEETGQKQEIWRTKESVPPPLVCHKKPIFLIKLRSKQQSNISMK